MGRLSGHVVWVEPVANAGFDPKYRAKCACGWAGSAFAKKPMAQQQGVEHGRGK